MSNQLPQLPLPPSDENKHNKVKLEKIDNNISTEQLMSDAMQRGIDIGHNLVLSLDEGIRLGYSQALNVVLNSSNIDNVLTNETLDESKVNKLLEASEKKLQSLLQTRNKPNLSIVPSHEK